MVLPVNFDFDQSECRPSQVLTSGTSDSVLRKYKMFNDGTDLTAGINKGYQNGFTATLIKFSKHRGGPESAFTVFFFLYSCQKRLDVLIRIRLKKVTGVILEIKTHKSKIVGVSNGLFFCNSDRLRRKTCSPMFGHLFDTVTPRGFGRQTKTEQLTE